MVLCWSKTVILSVSLSVVDIFCGNFGVTCLRVVVCVVVNIGVVTSKSSLTDDTVVFRTFSSAGIVLVMNPILSRGAPDASSVVSNTGLLVV